MAALQSRPTGNARLRKATLPAAGNKQPGGWALGASKTPDIPRHSSRITYADGAGATFYPDFPEPLKLKTVLDVALTQP